MRKFLKILAITTAAFLITVTSACVDNKTEKAVTISAQSGTLTEGIAGEATFAVTAANIADGLEGTILWYGSADGTNVAEQPAGITHSVSSLSAGKSTVTIVAGTDVEAGNYYFNITIDGAASNITTLTIGELAQGYYTVTVEQTEGGEATACIEGDTPAASVQATEGAQITLNVMVEEGYRFKKWMVAGEGSITFHPYSEAAEATFTMPAANVIVKAQIASESAYDEGILISGIVWATRNVSMPGLFADKPADPGLFYQWNRITGWSHTDPIAAYGIDGEISDAQWSATNAEGTKWASENDPCPEGWRVPTLVEFGRLYDDRHVTARWVSATGESMGGKTFTENSSGESIFIPAAGRRTMNTGELSLVGYEGFYWSATESNTLDHAGAWFLDFTSSKTVIQGELMRGLGQSVRCVAE